VFRSDGVQAENRTQVLEDGEMSGTNGDFTVSLIRDAVDTVPVPTKLSELVDGIASGRWAEPVQIVRAAFETGGKKAADAPKKKLPGILFSGTFSKRSNSALLVHPGQEQARNRLNWRIFG